MDAIATSVIKCMLQESLLIAVALLKDVMYQLGNAVYWIVKLRNYESDSRF